ncbi:Clavaminate synthase-like protein [Karstenula rhodostoma CBS 690.94]|uniref:Clavaminate synthase-like protein n=1 Tax=Karstenula rhodostoma CBS 690.94 TaxID=1392251 RepID=A0A9P4PH14_9PLEO|nr:Clavaminate synthase-like protein [Karstenula rhodostoma CBS 690.94]
MSSLQDLPPFPSDVPTAPIARIALYSLLASEPSACASVLEACRTHGFFYLDMASTPLGSSLLSASARLHEISHQVFDHDLDYKTAHDLIKGVSLFGYKRAGTVKTTDPTLRPDSTEFFNIAKDHVHAIKPSLSYPSEITAPETWSLLHAFTRDAHAVGMLILRMLATQLDVAPTAFTAKNDLNQPSGDHVRLTHQPARVPDATNAIGLPSHTDFGSVTLLFNWLGGLQIQSHDPAHLDEWAYVRPLAGHAVINLGDAMVTFTNGVLKSAKHRVVDAPGEQGRVGRYSVVYFVRPHDEAVMEACEEFKHLGGKGRVAGKFEPRVERGEVLRAGEWMRQRAVQLGS